jgi:hypothetical protein
MKENGMGENEKAEEQLLEEQLQAVTGGCRDCVGDKRNAALRLQSSARYETLSLQPELPPEHIQAFRNGATRMLSDAQVLLNRVVARHPEIDDPNINLPESFIRPPSPRE